MRIFSLITLFAVLFLAVPLPGSQAQVMIPISQNRFVSVFASTNAIVSAPDFGPFNASVYNSAYFGPFSNSYGEATATQASVISSSTISASGTISGYNVGFLGAVGQSAFQFVFSLDRYCTFTATNYLGVPIGSASALMSNSTTVVFDQYFPGGQNGTMTFSGTLAPGQYTLSAQLSSGPLNTEFTGSFSISFAVSPTNMPLQVSSVTVQSNNVLLTWTTTPGTNVVQATDGAADGSYSNNFLTISPLIIVPLGANVTVATNYLDVGGATNFPARYYRIALIQGEPILISPAALNFGAVAAGATSQQVFVVTNNGTLPVANGSATVTGGPFSIVSGTPFALAPGGSANVVVQFAPMVSGAFTSAVVFSTEFGLASSNTISGSTAILPMAQFSASPTNGAAPLTVTFTDNSTGTIANWSWNFGDGTATNLNTAGVSHTYTGPGLFSVSETVSGPAGTSSTNENNLVSVVLPAQLTVTPPSLNFGGLTVGQSSTQSFVVINSGSLTLNGTAAVSAPFQIGSGSPYNVGAGQTASVAVVFAPVTSGVYNASVVFNSNGGNSTNAVTGSAATSPPVAQFSAAPTSGATPLTVTFTDNSTGTITNWFWNFGNGSTTNLNTPGVSHTYTGTGLFSVTETVSGPAGTSSTNESNLISVVLPAQLTATPPSLNFGTVLAGQSSTQAFVVINSGSLTLNGTAAATAPFQIGSGSPYSVGAGQTSSVIVAFFAPATTGVYNASVIFTSNGGDATNAVSGWSATPPVAQFSAAPTNGGAPLAVTFTDNSTGTITNWFWNFGDGSTTNLNTPGVSHTYTGTGLFSVSETVSGPLGTSSTNESNLISVVLPAQLTVTPPSLNFGTVVGGQQSALDFAVINSGSLTLNGTVEAPAPFQINSAPAYSVGAGQTSSVIVAFSPPATAGVYNASVVFSSNGGSSTNAVTGTAIAPLVAQFSAAPTNGPAPLTVTFTDTSTGTITNWSWNFGDGAATNLNTAGASHTYTTRGVYTVSLTVTGPAGSNTETQADLITATHALLASDNAADAAYNGGWNNGSNGGSGFSPWTLTASGVIGSISNGYYAGSSTNNAFGSSPGIDTGGRSWALYAHGANFTAAYRGFSNSVPVGGTVKLDMDNGFIDAGNADGFVLRNGNANGSYTDYNTNARFEFLYIGGDSSNSYKVVDAAGLYNIGVGFTGTGLHLVFTLNSADTYTLLVIDNASGNTNATVNGTLGGTSGSTIDSIALYDRNAGTGAANDAFFNSLQIIGP